MPCGQITINNATFDASVAADLPPVRGNDILGGGPYREITYLVKGEEADQFMDAIMGIGPYSLIGPYSIYPNPHRYPGNESLVAVSVRTDPVGFMPSDTTLAHGIYEKVIVRYQTPRFDLTGERVAAEYPDLTGGTSLPFVDVHRRGYFATYQLPENTLDDAEAPGNNLERPSEVIMPQAEYTVVRRYVPQFYASSLDPLQGSVNESVFLGKPRGTVLFEGYDELPDETGVYGERIRIVEMRFTWRQEEWNSEPVAVFDGISYTAEWVPFKYSGKGFRYPYEDFSQIFEVF